jgi:cytochrome c oxidase subunit 4
MADSVQAHGHAHHAAAEHGGHDDHHFAHPVPVRLLLGVFVSLVTLTIVTVLVNELDLGQFDIWVALVIATIKASLVCLFFMHMYWEKGFNVIAFFSSIAFVTLFIGLTLMDTNAYREQLEQFPAERLPTPTVPIDSAESPPAGG